MLPRPALSEDHRIRSLPQGESVPLSVSLILRVDPRNAFQARRQLHSCMAPAPRIDVVADPNGHGQTTFIIKLAYRDVDALMHYVMTHLPTAEFGALGTRLATGAAR
ncbi:hypothetical protein [Bordetella sp. BOR01]|uniref:hypothetical protein n=1 Tax=Bordetella sp. BOR01 TaxID=2854779 RepID=UPI001C4804D9|nr:hypothetical protein [Bordetella sp. BOR01]MBV7486821.1 hypothetical protein [Bordetella sp. BOR01]